MTYSQSSCLRSNIRIVERAEICFAEQPNVSVYDECATIPGFPLYRGAKLFPTDRTRILVLTRAELPFGVGSRASYRRDTEYQCTDHRASHVSLTPKAIQLCMRPKNIGRREDNSED